MGAVCVTCDRVTQSLVNLARHRGIMMRLVNE